MPPSQPFRIVDSTLREGEQFAHASFTSDQRIAIARALDAFGVDVVEMTSPVASPRAARDFEAVARLGLSARVAAHVRCREDDARAAIDCGAQDLHVYLGTSNELRRHSHGRDLAGVLASVRAVLPVLRDRVEVLRFSCEDAFRTPARDLLRVVQAVEDLGVDRIGLADTVGAATPDEVAARVGLVRQTVDCDIEFHGHNDGGCAIANVWAAHVAGATHLDTTVLGIGERNGIASLSGLVARAFQSAPALVARFDVSKLVELDRYVAAAIGIEVPFNACITSPTAFAHKAGLHTKAVLAEPRCYESLDPAAFGRERDVLVGHALVGRHAMARHAARLGIELGDEELVAATREIKALADDATLGDAEIAAVLRRHATNTSPSLRA